jgi:hypothetical protein
VNKKIKKDPLAIMKTSPSDILHEVLASAANGHVIGIKIKDQSRMLITAVDKVLNQKTIVLKPSLLTGNSYQPGSLDFSQIESVIRFNSVFEDALSVQLREIKKLFVR